MGDNLKLIFSLLRVNILQQYTQSKENQKRALQYLELIEKGNEKEAKLFLENRRKQWAIEALAQKNSTKATNNAKNT